MRENRLSSKSLGEGQRLVYASVESSLGIFCKNYSKHKKAKILDIGTGPGTFLEACKLKDLDPMGTDNSPNAIKFIKAKGLKAIKSKLDEGDFEKASFDFLFTLVRFLSIF